MSGATMFRCANMAAFLLAVGGEARIPNELGKAEDDRLGQPDRVCWVPVERSGRIRECTNQYEDGIVFWERSNAYDVKLRGQDEAAARELETRVLNALVTLGATSPAVEIEEGDFDPFSVAAEQGCLITWRIRVWEPIYYQRYVDGHIATTTVGVQVNDPSNQVPGEP